MTEREVLTWELYGEAAGALSRQVVDSGFVPDVVLGIARGGLIPAASVAYAIDCKNLFTMNVEFYTGEGTTLEAPIFLPPLLDVAELDDLTVLVVDDVADSGETLKLVTEFCRPRAAEFRSAVLYEKPHSIVAPDYAWRRTDRWIDFPWSSNLP
jgi:uncharacterized protein